jgi:chemosensory pili system protein ChpA (sensor histidine kinase/response regulator)
MSTMMEYDTGPLNWVRGEIDKALKVAQERVQAFRNDPTLTNALRLARDETHLASGALRLVGLEGAATVCTAIEEVLGGVEGGNIQQAPGLDAVSSGLDGLARWVTRTAEGRVDGELALFPFYRSLRQLQGVERVFEGELFFPDLQARVGASNASDEISPEQFIVLVKSARAGFQRGLLAFLKGVGGEAGLDRMRNALTQIESAAPTNSSRAFWWACSGFIDALIAHGVEADFHVKQLLARIDLQMRRLLEGSPQVAERLMRDALFFIAKSGSLGGHAQEVKSTYRLDRYAPKGNVSAEALVRLRPVIESMKAELVNARNAWHDYTEAKAEGLERFQRCVGTLALQAMELGVPAAQPLLKSLQQSAASSAGAIAPETLNLEIATTLLFLQQALESEDLFSSDFANRSDIQCRRLMAAVEGDAMPENSIALMDEGSRQAREHAILAQLGQEVGVNLNRMEEILDTFFRNPENRDELPQLDQLAQQVSGALAILDQQSAGQLLQATMGLVRPCIDQRAVAGETEQHRIADAFSSLGLFVEAHCAGRVDAPNILTPILVSLGLMEAPVPATEMREPTVESGLPDRKTAVASAYLAWRAHPEEEGKKKLAETLIQLAQDADLVADGPLKEAVEALQATLQHQGIGQPLATQLSQLTGSDLAPPEVLSESNGDLSDNPFCEWICPVTFPEIDEGTGLGQEDDADGGPSAIEPSDVPLSHDLAPQDEEAHIAGADPTPCSAAPADELASSAPVLEPTRSPGPEEVDPDLLEIFLEEAEEVLDNLADATAACRSNAEDKESLTVVRRAFHTLKGSGRMVGLMDLGDVAWDLEQLMNSWLSADRPANHALLDTLDHAHEQLGDWVNALREHRASFPDMTRVRTRAALLAKGDEPDEIHPAFEAAVEPAPSDEVQVGSIHVSRGLYQIFMQEVGQRLDVLQAEMVRLVDNPLSPITEQATRAVHTLAGIAGTAGFNIMSDLAHVLELYWGKLEGQNQPTVALPAVDATVKRLGEMVFHIGQHVEPFPALDLIEVLARLPTVEGNLPVSVALLNEEVTGVCALPVRLDELAQPNSNSLDIEIVAPHIEAFEPMRDDVADGSGVPVVIREPAEPRVSDPAIEMVEQAIASAEPVSMAPEEASANGEVVDLPETPPSVDRERGDGVFGFESIASKSDAATPETPTAIESASPLRAAGAPTTPSPVFEQRMIQDELDLELLPVFLEESETLVSEAAQSLRAWKADPSGVSAPAALRRSLHTIKGSARMAGANRLGELTHHIETRVIDMLEGRNKVSTDVFEALESMFDRVVDAVEKLHAGPQPTPSILVETPVTHAKVVLPHVEAEPLQQRPVDVEEPLAVTAPTGRETPMLRVRADWVDRMVNQAGEVTIARSRIESEMFALKRHVVELAEALNRLRTHIREVEIQAESQMQATFQTSGITEQFDPLEFDRFTRFQEVTRFLAENVNDISTVQHALLGRLGETEAALTQQARMSRELQQDLLRVRMVPLYSISERLYRVVRQTARDLGKRAQIDIRNGELELDRSVLEKVTAPLEHLLRNAIAHGIEEPNARAAIGKPEYGEIQLDARHEGNEMVLVMKDDGAGLNVEKIRARALASGLLSRGMEPTDAQLAQIIFKAGFSTADQVTEVAGRGVGMDVVKSEITALGGRIDVASETGRGVTFTIYLPLTLAVSQAVIISANRKEYALPATMVGQVQELKPEQLSAALTAGAVEWRGARYPLFYLPHLLGQPDAIHEVQRFNVVVLMKSGSNHAAFLVDSVLGAREIVVKNIGPQLARITGIAGATVQGDGSIVLILNPVPLALRALQQGMASYRPTISEVDIATEDPNQAPLVMVVDDSLTVRKITGRLLTREGYRMETAKDGVDALEKMHDLTPDLVLLDVEMPRMDGFELARVMRGDPILKHVPIIMITSRTAEKHRSHALEIGVNLYIGKPYQETELLGHIAKLLGKELVLH